MPALGRCHRCGRHGERHSGRMGVNACSMAPSEEEQDITYLTNLQSPYRTPAQRARDAASQLNTTATPATYSTLPGVMASPATVTQARVRSPPPVSRATPGVPTSYTSAAAPLLGPAGASDMATLTSHVSSLTTLVSAMHTQLAAQKTAQEQTQAMLSRLLGPGATGLAPASTTSTAPTTTTPATAVPFPSLPSLLTPSAPLPGLLASAQPADVCLPNRCKITAKVADSALAGEYVNLLDFLPSTAGPAAGDFELVTEDGAVALRPRRSGKKVIDSFPAWLSAWGNYMSLLGSRNPTLYPTMLAHQNLIQEADTKFLWPAVYAFDCEARMFLSTTRSMAFGEFQGNLYTARLDASVVKAGTRCFRCNGTDHQVKDCTFPPTAAVEKAAQKKAATPSAASAQGGHRPQQQQQRAARPTPPAPWYFQNKEGCNNYQTNRCRLNPCHRAHVCAGCRGPHPQAICPTCNGGGATPAEPRPLRAPPH